MLQCVCSVIDHRWRQNVGFKNKTVAHEAIAELVTVVLTTFWHLLWSITEQTHPNMESICIVKNKLPDRKLYISKSFNMTRKRACPLRPLWQTRKKPCDVIYCLYKWAISLVAMGSKRSLIGPRNHTTVKLD